MSVPALVFGEGDSEISEEDGEEEPGTSSDMDAEVEVGESELVSVPEVVEVELGFRGPIPGYCGMLWLGGNEAELDEDEFELLESEDETSDDEEEVLVLELVPESVASVVVDGRDWGGGDVGAEPMSVGELGVEGCLEALCGAGGRGAAC